jgi:hypothetical protein
LLLLVPPDAQGRVYAALAPLGLQRMHFALETRGAHTLVDEDDGTPPSAARDNACMPDVRVQVRAGAANGRA